MRSAWEDHSGGPASSAGVARGQRSIARWSWLPRTSASSGRSSCAKSSISIGRSTMVKSSLGIARRVEDDFERSVSRDAWHEEPFVIMSSHLARRQDRQPRIARSREALGPRHSGRGSPREDEGCRNPAGKRAKPPPSTYAVSELRTARAGPPDGHPLAGTRDGTLGPARTPGPSRGLDAGRIRAFLSRSCEPAVTNESLDWLSGFCSAPTRRIMASFKEPTRSGRQT